MTDDTTCLTVFLESQRFNFNLNGIAWCLGQ